MWTLSICYRSIYLLPTERGSSLIEGGLFPTEEAYLHHQVRAEEPYLHPFVSKRREMAQPVPTKAFLQPAKAAAMCTAPRAETLPPPPSHLFASAKPLNVDTREQHN